MGMRDEQKTLVDEDLEWSRDDPEPAEGDSVPAKCGMPAPSADLPRRKCTADIIVLAGDILRLDG